MYAVLVNAVAIMVGACLGLVFKNLMTERLAKSIEIALGVCTFALGIKMALKYENVLIMILCVVVGGVLGTVLKIEENCEKFAVNLQRRFSGPTESRFAKAFTMASILYCTGAYAIVGSINAGVLGDFEILYTKSLMDGIFAISFSAVYGIGVAMAAIPVFIYQGSITLFASHLKILTMPQIINEISGVGGVLLVMIGINITGLKKIPVGDYLPALLLVMIIAPLIY